MLLRHFAQGKRIDDLQALQLYGIRRLASRIHDLKRFGLKIDSEFHKYVSPEGIKKRFMLYSTDLKNEVNISIFKAQGIIE
ncbi:MAG: hypothetical protein FGM22_07415 [Burkholderiaceae bacterium]|nr:hypothetical protein [Burkholderiaceae bacterium]